jgi:hypothetical protein
MLRLWWSWLAWRARLNGSWLRQRDLPAKLTASWSPADAHSCGVYFKYWVGGLSLRRLDWCQKGYLPNETTQDQAIDENFDASRSRWILVQLDYFGCAGDCGVVSLNL